MKIYVVSSSKNETAPLDEIRELFLIDEKHEGKNIDFLDPWYCELTGLYYLLNNTTDEIIGLEQYRRFLSSSNHESRLSQQEIEDRLKDFDVICAKEHYPNVNGPTIYSWPINTGKRKI